MQGCTPIYDNVKWMIVEDDLINFYAKRQENVIERPKNIRIDDIMLQELSDLEKKGISIKSKREQIKRSGIK